MDRTSPGEHVQTADDRTETLRDLVRRGDDSAFALLVEGTTDYAIFMLDPDGFIASWNAVSAGWA